MTRQINSSTDYHAYTQDDILGDGQNGSSSALATSTIALSPVHDRGDVVAANTSSANAAATFTIAAPGPDTYIQLVRVFFGYGSDPTGGLLTVDAAGLTNIVIPVTASGAGEIDIPLRGAVNSAISVTLAAGGSGVVGYVAAIYRTVVM